MTCGESMIEELKDLIKNNAFIIPINLANDFIEGNIHHGSFKIIIYMIKNKQTFTGKDARKYLKMGLQQYQNCIKELKEKGYLEVQRIGSTSYKYKILI